MLPIMLCTFLYSTVHIHPAHGPAVYPCMEKNKQQFASCNDIKAYRLCCTCRGLKRALEEANLNSGAARTAAGPQQSSPAVYKQLPALSATTAPADPTSDTENQKPASSQVHIKHAIAVAYLCCCSQLVHALEASKPHQMCVKRQPSR